MSISAKRDAAWALIVQLRRLGSDLKALKSREPAYEIEAVFNHLSKFARADVRRYETAYVGEETAELLITRLEKMIQPLKDSHPTLFELELKAKEKWYGPQGGIAPWSDQRDAVYAYCDTKRWESPYAPLTQEQALDVVDLFMAFMPQGPLPRLALLRGQSLLETYKGVKRSLSGVYLWEDRRSISCRMRSFYAALKHPWVFDPVVLAQRLQRCKLRSIFMDTLVNLFRANRVLRPLHDWLLSSGIPSWRGSHVVEKELYEFVQGSAFTALELDYKDMDKGMTLEATEFWFKAFFDRVPATREYVKETFRLLKAIYHIDILSPDGIIRGKKHMLSGLPPTNDWETFVNLFINLAFLLYHTWKGKPLASYRFKLFVLGDDVIIIILEAITGEIECTITGETFTDYRVAMATWAERFAFTAEPSKQAVRSGCGIFCKHYFEPSLRQYVDPTGLVHPGSAYPLVLAFNNIFHPERLNHPSWAEYQALRIYQILDECHAHPFWKGAIRLLVEASVLPLVVPSDAAVSAFRAEEKDWRYHLYGLLYEFRSSPTYQYLAGAGLLGHSEE